MLSYYQNRRIAKINRELNQEESIGEIKKKSMFIEDLIGILTIYVLFLTIIGFWIYLGEKRNEYRKNFSYYKFLLGVPECEHLEVSSVSNEKEDLIKYMKNGFKI